MYRRYVCNIHNSKTSETSFGEHFHVIVDLGIRVWVTPGIRGVDVWIAGCVKAQLRATPAEHTKFRTATRKRVVAACVDGRHDARRRSRRRRGRRATTWQCLRKVEESRCSVYGGIDRSLAAVLFGRRRASRIAPRAALAEPRRASMTTGWRRSVLYVELVAHPIIKRVLLDGLNGWQSLDETLQTASACTGIRAGVSRGGCRCVGIVLPTTRASTTIAAATYRRCGLRR